MITSRTKIKQVKKKKKLLEERDSTEKLFVRKTMRSEPAFIPRNCLLGADRIIQGTDAEQRDRHVTQKIHAAAATVVRVHSLRIQNPNSVPVGKGGGG